MTLDLSPAMGQASVGPLAFTLHTSADESVRAGTPGGIYYVPDGPALAIYYDDLGQTVPPPGLVPLGTIADPDAITRLGRTGRITLEPVVPPQR